MPVDVYYSAGRDAKTVTPVQLAEEISKAGFPSAIEPEPETTNMFRIVLEPLQSTLVLSIEGGSIVFVTFEASPVDDQFIELNEAVEKVMNSLGFNEEEAY